MRDVASTATTIEPASYVHGSICVPGDKSISHRYAIVAALADGESTIRTYAPQVRIAPVRKTLTKRRRFDAAARALGDGAPRYSLAPVVDGYMRCLSATCAEWRAANPVPEPDGREHGYPRTALLELAREMRQASAARGLGSLGLVGGA